LSGAQKLIDTQRFAEQLRAQAIDTSTQRILISRLTGSGQEVDLTEPANCNGYGRVRHFQQATAAGWPSNPLPIVPACKALGLTPPDKMNALVFQNAACAWRCWYCFVPEELLRADRGHSSWFSADDLVALYTAIPDRPVILDLSGGSPDLVPEWTPWMMRSLQKAGLSDQTYLWTDDNLSTTYLFDKVAAVDVDLMRSYRNYGRVCCIKGFDRHSFSFNTRAAPEDFDRQFEILRRVMDLGLDVYGYVTLTAPESTGVDIGVSNLLDRLQQIDPNFPLRVVPLRIQVFSPVQHRLERDEDRIKSMEVQELAIAAWMNELHKRYDDYQRNLPITEVPLTRRGA
jgi:uncharacterized Fe-S cluster-containing radical SAM superfamily protein